MNKVLIGLFCMLVVIALLFNFSDNYDYTYNGRSYGIDFSTPSELNSMQIESSFSAVIRYGNTFVSFCTDTVSDIIETFSSELQTDDVVFNAFYADLRERSLAYIEENYSVFTRWWHKNSLNTMTDVLRGYSKFLWFEGPLYLQEDLTTFIDEFGWTSQDVATVHNYMVKNGLGHYYNGEYYDGE